MNIPTTAAQFRNALPQSSKRWVEFKARADEHDSRAQKTVFRLAHDHGGHAHVEHAYLREQDLVKTIGDTARNERRFRYSAVLRARDDEITEQSTGGGHLKGWAVHSKPAIRAGMNVQPLEPGNQWRREARG